MFCVAAGGVRRSIDVVAPLWPWEPLDRRLGRDSAHPTLGGASTRADVAGRLDEVSGCLPHRRGRRLMTAATPPPLPADLAEGLKRLRMAAMR